MMPRGCCSSRAILLGIAVALGAVVSPLLAREPVEPQPHRTIGDLIAHPTEVQPDEPTGASLTEPVGSIVFTCRDPLD